MILKDIKTNEFFGTKTVQKSGWIKCISYKDKTFVRIKKINTFHYIDNNNNIYIKESAKELRNYKE